MIIRKKKERYKILHVRVKNKLLLRMDEICIKSRCSRNELINKCLKYALDRCVVEEK